MTQNPPVLDKSVKDFELYTDTVVPHIIRCREIMKAHPEVKNLIGPFLPTFFITIAVVGFQLGMAALLSTQPWWLILLAAYCVGAFANHSLFVLIHEYTHNLVFKNRKLHTWAGILCDFANVMPTFTGFRTYHIKHHAYMGHHDLDADLASRWEAKMIGNTFFGKAIWLLLFPIFQMLRPPRLKDINMWQPIVFVNIAAVFIIDIVLVYFFGWGAIAYLALSFVFSVGLHPLGARWIQEHYLVKPPQETYSYYGPLNLLAFNVGFHNEHHDFPSIAWVNLPKLRKLAPEYYDTLHYHTSWTRLFLKFLFDKNLSLFSRSLRPTKEQMS